MRAKSVAVVVATAAILAVGAVPAGSADLAGSDVGSSPADTTTEPVIATFEGRTFDMTGDWGEAKHCVVSDDGVECFRTRTEAAAVDGGPTDADLEVLRRAGLDLVDAEPDEASAETLAPADDGGLAAASSGCTLTLYANSYFSGSSVSITTSGIVSLASLGFDQRASSWTEPGSCSATFWDYKVGSSYIGQAGPFSASGDCCLWNNYWDTGGSIDNDISYARRS